MKFTLLRQMLAIICLLLGTNLYAFVVDGVEYYTTSESTVSVNGVTESIVYIPSEVVYDNKTYTVTEISSWGDMSGKLVDVEIAALVSAIPSFCEFTALERVVLPSSIIELSYEHFKGCTQLASVEGFSELGLTVIESGMFEDCTSLKSITLPKNVEHITECVFRNCTALRSVVLPESLLTISNQAFQGCSALSDINLPEKLYQVRYEAFDGCTSVTELRIPASLSQDYNMEGLRGCTEVTKLTLGDVPYFSNMFYKLKELYIEESHSIVGLELSGFESSELSFVSCNRQLGNNAFNFCSSLEQVELGGGFTYFPVGIFSGCGNLSEVNMTANIDSICSYAFSGCESLQSFNMPESVKKIGEYAFERCIGLTAMDIPLGVTELGEYAFAGCFSLNDLNIPAGIEELATGVFSGCSGLMNVSFNNGLKKIGSYAFNGCNSLTNITLPESVTRIEDCAFFDCSRVERLEIGGNVEYIGDGAFYQHYSLVDFYYGNTLEEWLKIEMDHDSYPEDTNPITYAENFYLVNDDKIGGYHKVTDLVIPQGVDSIPEYRFYNYRGLTSLRTESTLSKIGEEAFCGCLSLNTVDIDVVTIDKMAFANTQIEHLILGASLKQIKFYAFYGFSTIAQLTYMGTLRDWCSIDFADDTYIQKEHFNIKGDEFGEVTDLEITWDMYVKEIKPCTFAYTGSLTSVSLPYPVESVGNYAFSGCKNLTTVTAKKGITKIGKHAFSNCPKLTSVVLKEVETPQAVHTASTDDVQTACEIGDYAFAYDNNLGEILLPDNVTYVGGDAFDGTAWYESQPDGMLYVGTVAYSYKGAMPDNTTFSIKEGTTMISPYVFGSVSDKLVGVSMPSSVKNIGNYAFSDCYNLKNIEMSGVEIIGESAFNYCSSLVDVDWSSLTNLEKIGANAFSGTGIKTVELPANLKTVAANAFKGCQAITDFKIQDSATTLEVECSELGDALICSGQIENVYIGCNVSLQGKTLHYNGIPITFYNYLFDSYSMGNLKNISLGETVTEISENWRFVESLNNTLESITCMSTTPPVVALGENWSPEYAFGEYGSLKDCVLYIPMNTKDAYSTAAFWENFLKIEEKEMVTGIENNVVEENAPVEYYNLNGVRVLNPESGVFIKRQGGKTTKVVL